MITLTEERLHNIIIESIDKLLLTEDKESKSRDKARRLAFNELGDKQEADKLVEKVRSDLGLYNNAAVFTYAGVRMYLNNEYDDSTKDKLASVIRLIADKYLDRYTYDLNAFYAQELINIHFPEVQAMRDSDRNKLDSNKYTGVSDYDIVRIDSFEQATEYSEYTEWCVTHDKKFYNQYTSNGLNQFYFCLRKGFKQVPQKEGEGCPLDEYGLSMFAVRVNGDGDLIGCTTRWNLSDKRDQNAMNVEQISDVIQMPFYKVFKPNTTWRDALDDATQRLANGEYPDGIFEDCRKCGNGFLRVKLLGKYNIINPQNYEFLSDKWFNECYKFKNGFAVVSINHGYNFINKNGQFITELPTASESIKGKWFGSCDDFADGFGKVILNNKQNFINRNGQLITELPTASKSIIGKWFFKCHDFNEGFARIDVTNDSINELMVMNQNIYRYNFINRNGQLITELPTTDESIRGQWFDECGMFNEGVGNVAFSSDCWGYINQKGEIVLRDERHLFDYCGPFKEGFARVQRDRKWNFINQNGELLSKNQWFYYCEDFQDGFADLRLMSGKCCYIDKYGNVTEELPQVSESYLRGYYS